MVKNEVSRIFNGKYTVQNRVTGEHRTFQIKTQKEDASFAPGKRILSLLTGSNNESDYTGFAFVTEEGINVWSSKRGGDFDKYANLLWSLTQDGGLSVFATRYSLMVEGRCIVCNRALTTPESILTGIGPVCDGRKAGEAEEEASDACGHEECDGEPCMQKQAQYAPAAGSWASVAQMMATLGGGNDGMDWDAWKDEMKESGGY